MSKYKVDDGLYVALINDMTLEEVAVARREFCSRKHCSELQVCSQCEGLISFAHDVINNGIVELKAFFIKHFPKVKYISSKAVRLLMQLPLIVMEIAPEGPGSKRLYATEFQPGVDAQRFVVIMRQFLHSKKANVREKLPSRQKINALCELATTETDRLLLKMTACSELSAKEARKRYGVQNLGEKQRKIEETLRRASEIKQTVAELARVKEKALLCTIGFDYESSDSEDESTDLGEVQDVQWISSEDATEDEEEFPLSDQLHSNKGQHDTDSSDHGSSFVKVAQENAVSKEKGTSDRGMFDPDDTDILKNPTVNPAPSRETLLLILRENNLNWFTFVAELKNMLPTDNPEVLNQILVDFADFIPYSDLSTAEEQLIEISRQAYLEIQRKQSLGNAIFETDSESDDGDWCEINDICSDEAKEKVQQERKKIKMAAKRETSKLIAKEALLKCKIPKKVSTIVTKYPDIGKKMEDFVQKHRVGADQWRRTGVFTFASNKNSTGPKVTYKRMQEHLQKEYGISISYGTVVQLCAVRNKRRISAQRYQGVAAITCRRARKGFDVKFNPDSRWSYCFYKGLDMLQLKDGSDKMILNRDDQAGFRLDSTYTHKNHKAVCLEGKPELTSHSDYVSKHGGQLQTSSYLFMKTETTGQVSVGIVKAPGVLHEKTATQHLADLYCLKEKAEMDVCFEGKNIDCIRVDGGADEGPSHVEVQFRWTEWHLKEGRELTLVTTRNSGASCYNLVELQNGVVGRAHANLFIPSTLCGSAETETGGVSQDRLHENMEAALQVYLDRVNDIPFGSSVIKMYRGATDKHATELKDQRQNLLVYLRGTKAAKAELKKKEPNQYHYFEQVWNLRNQHMVPNLPSGYVFALKACYKEGCIHPVCKNGKPANDSLWFPGGPSIQYLPFPVPDPKRPWGAKECDKCSGICSGHYKGPEEVLAVDNCNLSKASISPPSTVIKDAFDKKQKECLELTSDEIEKLAKQTLLRTDEVEMWVRHLSDVRKHRQAGAQKASAKRKENSLKKKSSKAAVDTPDSWCICGGPECGDMIACEHKDCPIEWFHFQCVGLSTAPSGEWICAQCKVAAMENSPQ